MKLRTSAFLVMILVLPFIGCSVKSAAPNCSFTVNVSEPPAAGWRLVDKTAFQFYIPKDLHEQSVQGIDSQVWQYKSETMRLDIDYGIYSGFPDVLLKEKDYSEEIWCINKRKALVCAYSLSEPDGSNANKAGGKKMIGIFFLTEKETDIKPAFSVEAATEEEIKVARQIFQTVRFRN